VSDSLIEVAESKVHQSSHFPHSPSPSDSDISNGHLVLLCNSIHGGQQILPPSGRVQEGGKDGQLMNFDDGGGSTM